MAVKDALTPEKIEAAARVAWVKLIRARRAPASTHEAYTEGFAAGIEELVPAVDKLKVDLQSAERLIQQLRDDLAHAQAERDHLLGDLPFAEAAAANPMVTR